MFSPHQGPPGGPPLGMHMGTPPPPMMGPLGPLPMPMGPGGPMMDYPGPPHNIKMEPNDHMRGFPQGPGNEVRSHTSHTSYTSYTSPNPLTNLAPQISGDIGEVIVSHSEELVACRFDCFDQCFNRRLFLA